MAGKLTANNGMPMWIREPGPEADVVLSSRVRLARNLTNYRFTDLASDEELRSVVNEVAGCVKDSPGLSGLSVTMLAELSPSEREILVVKHLISTEQAENVENKAVVLDKDESVSVMVNEEDHLRLQTLLPGLQLGETWKLASDIDDSFEARLSYAFSEELGYLTACPTNLGTGIRVSAMMHLPALGFANQIGKVLSAVFHLGLAVRGLYGEGTQALGSIYQISNQVTLGHSEAELVDHVESVARQIVSQERNARELILKQGRRYVEDRVFRAYGILSNARIIDFKELIELFSDIRLGVHMGLIDSIDPLALNQLLVVATPAYLEMCEGRELSSSERDIARADVTRELLL